MWTIPPLDLTETPGIYYSLAYGFSAILFIRLNRQRQGKGRFVTFALLWAVQMLFMLFTYRIEQRYFMLCLAVHVLMIYGMIRSCCVMDRTTCAYYTVRAYMVGEFAASLEWQFFYYALTALRMPLSMCLNLGLLIITHGVTFSVISYLEGRCGGKNEHLPITWKELRNVVLITAVIYAISNISYALRNTPFSSQWTMEIYTIRTLADLGGIAILFGYHMVLHEMHTRQEADRLQAVLDREYTHYQASRDAMDLVNRRYHDLKHQILYLKSSITEEERRSALDTMEEEISGYEALSRTGHPVVDTILSEKGLQCRDRKITLKVIADGEAMAFLPTAEICSLLGNSLDNAIEAASQIAREEERLIRVYIERRKSFLRLSVENRFVTPVRYAEGGKTGDGTSAGTGKSRLPLTTKEDASAHGIGLRSIESIARAHDGSLQIRAEDGWFRLQVLIPIPPQAGKKSGSAG